MQFCPKHDIVYGDGGKCWCCEQGKKKEGATKETSKPARVPVATGGK